MEKLIYHLAQSLRERQITNNIPDYYFKKVPKKLNDWVSVASTVAMVLKEQFIDNGYKDVYPYAVFYTEFSNEMVNLREAAWQIGIKGQSIEYGNKLVEEADEFLEKMTELEHHLYDQYLPLDNKFLPPIFEYKKASMRREKDFEEEFGRHFDSAFILVIPASCED